MTSNASAPGALVAVPSPAGFRHLVPVLERFWPSRRSAAFDEFCPR